MVVFENNVMKHIIEDPQVQYINYLIKENKQLKEALTDVLEGNSVWYDIQYNTGLSEKRCKEIEELYINCVNEDIK